MTSGAPLVTVYILNYNYANYIDQCIESVLAQDYPNVEILIIDDGSTDNSKEVLDKRIADDRLVIVFQENIGLIRSIRKAFSLAKGEFVIRVDADDWVAPNFLSALVKKVESNSELALVFPDYFEVDSSGTILHRVRRRDFDEEVTLLDQPAHGACTLIRKSAYDSVGGHNEDIECQDGYDIWLAITYEYKVSNCSIPLFYYRKHSVSLSTNNGKLLRNRALIYKNHAIRRGFKKEKTIAFIPLRSLIYEGREFFLREVNGKPLLDWSLEKSLHSFEIDEIVVSTDSKTIENYIKNWISSKKLKKDISIHRRSKALAQQGSHLNYTIISFLGDRKLQEDSLKLVVVTPNYPFTDSDSIDTAIYSSFLYDVDMVDSVVEDNSIIFFHDGHGLMELHSGEIRYERDSVFIRKGGLSVYNYNYLNLLSTEGYIVEKRVRKGHIVVDEYSAFEVKNIYDIDIASCIAQKIPGI